MATTLNGANVSVSLDPVMINDANVVTADIMATNGVIHIIDAVLIPPFPEEDAPEEEGEGEGEEPMESIVDIAVGNDDFSTLVELLSAAGLVEALEGDGPFTVFAPTNDAFAALDDATLEAVAADADLLTSVLLYCTTMFWKEKFFQQILWMVPWQQPSMEPMYQSPWNQS